MFASGRALACKSSRSHMFTRWLQSLFPGRKEGSKAEKFYEEKFIPDGVELELFPSSMITVVNLRASVPLSLQNENSCLLHQLWECNKLMRGKCLALVNCTVTVASSYLWFQLLPSSKIWKYWMENSKNKQFMCFQFGVILGTMMRSQAVLSCAT